MARKHTTLIYIEDLQALLGPLVKIARAAQAQQTKNLRWDDEASRREKEIVFEDVRCRLTLQDCVAAAEYIAQLKKLAESIPSAAIRNHEPPPNLRAAQESIPASRPAT